MNTPHFRTDLKTGRFVSTPVEERFWSKVLKTDECWIWQAGLDKDGYGQVKDGGTKRAARVAWIMENGPIQDGLVVDHLCRVRACVNPSHLRLITNGENVLCGEGHAAKNARKTSCPHGHLLSGDNLYRDPSGHRRCRACQKNTDRGRFR